MRRLALLLLLPSGCESTDTGNGDDAADADTDTDTDADTDTDTDPDTDTDTDPDTDADTDPPPMAVCVLVSDERYDGDAVTLLQLRLYEYDERRFLVKQTDEFGVFEDPPDNTFLYTNDDEGRVLLQETDNASDGTINSVIRYAYDAAGRLSETELDLGNDGLIETLTTWTYDGSGRVVLITVDSDTSDGEVEVQTASTYNDDGDLWIEETTDEDGEIVSISTQTYNKLRQLILREYDAFGDGTVDFTYTYTYDVDGNVAGWVYSDVGAGEILQMATYTYDANGNVLTWLQEFPDSVVLLPALYTYTYDSFGNLILVESDLNVDGIDVSPRVFTWDCPEA